MKDPTLVHLPHPDYILKFDPYKHVEETYERALEEVRQGRTLSDFHDSEHFSKLAKNSINEVQEATATAL